MTESALEKARRELNEAVDRAWADGYIKHDGSVAIIKACARLEAAAREDEADFWRAAVEKWAGVALGSIEANAIIVYTGKWGGTPSMMLPAIVAAARLAGREDVLKMLGLEMRDWCEARLRREAGESHE